MKKIISILLLSIFSTAITMDAPNRQTAARQKMLRKLMELGDHEKLDEFCAKGGAAVISQEIYNVAQKRAIGKNPDTPENKIAAIISAYSPTTVTKMLLTKETLRQFILENDSAKVDIFCDCGGGPLIDREIYDLACARANQKSLSDPEIEIVLILDMNSQRINEYLLNLLRQAMDQRSKEGYHSS